MYIITTIPSCQLVFKIIETTKKHAEQSQRV
jgi:hypothetical protein